MVPYCEKFLAPNSVTCQLLGGNSIVRLFSRFCIYIIYIYTHVVLLAYLFGESMWVLAAARLGSMMSPAPVFFPGHCWMSNLPVLVPCWGRLRFIDHGKIVKSVTSLKYAPIFRDIEISSYIILLAIPVPFNHIHMLDTPIARSGGFAAAIAAERGGHHGPFWPFVPKIRRKRAERSGKSY